MKLTKWQAQIEKLQAKLALCRVYQVMELPYGKHIACDDGVLIDALIKSGMYDDALTEGKE
jgi:hypothetical protein